MTDTIIGKDIKKRELMRKYMTMWAYHIKDVRMKKALK